MKYSPGRDRSENQAFFCNASLQHNGVEPVDSTSQTNNSIPSEQCHRDLLNGVIHDLRAPLHGLSLRTSLAEMQLADGNAQGLKEGLAEMQKAIQGVSEMIDSLLESAQDDSVEGCMAFERFSLVGLCLEVFRDIGPVARHKKLKLDCAICTDLEIVTDRMKLKRILNNLFGNAVKFTFEGSITLECARREGCLELHVVDTGIGIPSHEMTRIFDRFYQLQSNAHPVACGFGLGLGISRRLVAALGGRIRVESAIGKGSRFIVVLPQAIAGEQSRSKHDATICA